MVRKFGILLALLFCFCTTVKAQDIHFSQFYESTALRNPALSGIFQNDYKVSLQYKNQWSSITNPFVTGQMSFEARIPVKRTQGDFFGAGILGYMDKAGSINLKSNAVYASISYNKLLQGTTLLSAGFTGGLIQRSFDPSKITVDAQYHNGSFHPNHPTGEEFSRNKLSYFDIGAGISLSSGGEDSRHSYFLGISGYHFTQPRESFFYNEMVRKEIRWNFNAGLTYRVNETFGWIAQGNASFQGSYREIILGGLTSIKKNSLNQSDPVFIFYAGLFYRLQDALIPIVKIAYQQYAFGFSYDVNTSSLKAASKMRGGFEVSFVKTGFFRNPDWQKSRTTCPHFMY